MGKYSDNEKTDRAWQNLSRAISWLAAIEVVFAAAVVYVACHLVWKALV